MTAEVVGRGDGEEAAMTVNIPALLPFALASLEDKVARSLCALAQSGPGKRAVTEKASKVNIFTGS